MDTSKPTLVLMDSGGGSQLQLSCEASLVAESFGLELFIFGRNMTPAVCALDQQPNAQAERRYHQLLGQAADVSALGALSVARDVFEHAYVEKHIVTGYRDVGMVSGAALNRSKLLVDRSADLIKSFVPWTTHPMETAEASSLTNPRL